MCWGVLNHCASVCIWVNMSCALLYAIVTAKYNICMWYSYYMGPIHFQISILETGRFKKYTYLCTKVFWMIWMWPDGGFILMLHFYIFTIDMIMDFQHFLFTLLSTSGNHNFNILYYFYYHFQVFLTNIWLLLQLFVVG